MYYLNFLNIALFIVVVAVLWLILTYNSLIKYRYRAREAWSDIDVQLKRRYDLIPNLVETVKGYAGHEKSTLDAVISARARATQISVDPAKITAEQIIILSEAQLQLSQAIGRLLALSENYPQLKANENFLELQRELSDTENKIQAARRFYNGNVMDYNTKIEIFPNNLIAGLFGFCKEEFFGLEKEEEKKPVKVGF